MMKNKDVGLEEDGTSCEGYLLSTSQRIGIMAKWRTSRWILSRYNLCLQYILSIVSSASKVLISRLSGENKTLYAKALSLAYVKELLRYNLTDFFLTYLRFLSF